MMIVEKFVGQLRMQLEPKKVVLKLSPEAKDWLADKGYDAVYGARPLNRLIQDRIRKPLAEELLFGKLVKGGVVTVNYSEGDLQFTFS